MKRLLPLLFFLVIVVSAVSCTDDHRRVSKGVPYTLTGTLWQDSTTIDSVVTLVVDRHEACFSVIGDTIPAFEILDIPVVQGRFSYEGYAPIDADELFISDQHGHVARMYGTSGADLSFEVLKTGEVQVSGLDSTDLCRALCLRDSIPFMDSLDVRRALGKLPEQAKPAWLMDDIDLELAQKSKILDKRFRLPRTSVILADTLFNLLDSRPNAMVLMFWATYDSASVDSLAILKQVARDYGLYTTARAFETDKSPTRSKKAHRIELLSVCLNTDDSASWKTAIDGIPGQHTCLQGGFSHPLAAECHIQKLPFILVVDRFGNYMSHDKWGEDLYRILNRTPLNSELNNRISKLK